MELGRRDSSASCGSDLSQPSTLPNRTTESCDSRTALNSTGSSPAVIGPSKTGIFSSLRRLMSKQEDEEVDTSEEFTSIMVNGCRRVSVTYKV